MIKSELINRIAELLPDVPRKVIDESVDIVFDTIAETMSKGGRVEIRGFGTFEGRRRKGRKARNPRSGTTVNLPERIYPFFKASREMIEYINSDR